MNSLSARPSVSVVIPLFNKEDTIERAVSSIISQSFQDFEIIIIDDGSTDGSLARATSLHDARLHIHSQRNSGPGAARNFGVSLAQAPLLAFLDADDEWRPDYLKEATTAFQLHPECRAYVCGYDAGAFRAQRPNKVEALGRSKGPLAPPFALHGRELKMAVDAFHSSAVVATRDIFNHFGGFYAAPDCRFGEDSWLWAKVLLSGNVFWDPAEHVRFHVEDSDLGFSVRRRTTARPITLHFNEFCFGSDPDAQAGLRRLAAVFAQSDYNILMASGSWAAAAAVRRQYGLGGQFGPLKEILKRLKFNLKRLTGAA